MPRQTSSGSSPTGAESPVDTSRASRRGARSAARVAANRYDASTAGRIHPLVVVGRLAIPTAATDRMREANTIVTNHDRTGRVLSQWSRLTPDRRAISLACGHGVQYRGLAVSAARVAAAQRQKAVQCAEGDLDAEAGGTYPPPAQRRTPWPSFCYLACHPKRSESLP